MTKMNSLSRAIYRFGSLVSCLCVGFTAQAQEESVEKDYKVHRLATEETAAYDAFVYMNRINAVWDGKESPEAFAGRVFGTLGNLEGRILVKVPPKFEKDEYEGLKAFYRTSGEAKTGNCTACHLPPVFSDMKEHKSGYTGKSTLTPTLRNLPKTAPYMSDGKLETILDVVKFKQALGEKARAGKAGDIDPAYAKINLSDEDAMRIAKFLVTLDEVGKEGLRELIMESTILDTEYVYDE